MANTPMVSVRVEPGLTDAARDALGIPAEAGLGVVVRAALAVIAGVPRSDALKHAVLRDGPKPKTRTAA